MHLFYTPEIEKSAAFFTLTEEESKHCIKVIRLKENSAVTLVDGRGGWYKGTIAEAHPKRTRIQIHSFELEQIKSARSLHIAIAPTKNIDRFEWFLEKATEIGIEQITPLLTAHSERKEVNLARLNKRITSAMKQSLKGYHPLLNPLTPFKQFISQDHSAKKLIAHCIPGEKPYLTEALKKGEPCVLLIGPEGDFSPSEVELSVQQGYQEISLGTARLRTETAGLAACFEVNLLNREL